MPKNLDHMPFLLATYANEEPIKGKSFLSRETAEEAACSYADINEVPVRILEHAGEGVYWTHKVVFPKVD